MSRNSFFDVVSDVNVFGAPAYPSTEVDWEFPVGLFEDAEDHWRLKGSSASLTGLVNGLVLTPNGTGPTYNASSVLTDTGLTNGLLSTIADIAVFTEAMLIKRPAALTTQTIGGTVTSSSSAGGDSGFWFTVGGVDTFRWTTRPNTTGPAQAIITPPESWSPGEWGVVVCVHTAAARKILMMAPDGRTVPIDTRTGVKQVATGSRKRSVGCVHNSTGGVSLEVAEFVNWSSDKSEDDMYLIAEQMLRYAASQKLV